MAPGYRASGQSRRANRGNVANHDLFEGIPVRQWRRDIVTVAPQPTHESSTVQNDIWAVELPHGMPKDYLDLPQHSQDLLRAARSGKIYKRPAPSEEEEVDPELVGEKPDKKDEDPKERGFTARAWKHVSRELPPIDYLAKRRKGLIRVGTKPATAAPVATVTKATVRRVDAAGNTYVQDMVVANGQKVEGEVIAQTVIPGPSTSEVQPSPIKRKPIKRKIKGPGRGRKKKMLPSAAVPGGLAADGQTVQALDTDGSVDQNGIKKENADTPMGGVHEDTEMGDDSNQASDDEDGDEGDEGDDDEEGTPEVQDSPGNPLSITSPIPEVLPSLTTAPILEVDIEMTDVESPQPATVEKLKLDLAKSGSPLKNVALSTSNINTPLASPGIPETTTTEVPESDAAPTGIEPVSPDLPVPIVATEDLPPPPPNPTEEHVEAAQTLVQEEIEEEEMLLDTLEGTNQTDIQEPALPVTPTPITTSSPAKDIKPDIENEDIQEGDRTNVPQQEDDIVQTDDQLKDSEAPKNEETSIGTEIKQDEPNQGEDVEPIVQDKKEDEQPEEAEKPSEEVPLKEQADIPDLLGDLEKTLGA
ncbi:hypothetical protein BP6252_05738 [Coleophoma cylindrospora]|uniref:Lyr family protein n=1 Tax=Coleophoma cylindrospora TaxID=1849047 RepID=A0A3D8RUK1_9HELO|nr:hypothetical protein BP6252_05738 [Coleophoma cylindrospora]